MVAQARVFDRISSQFGSEWLAAGLPVYAGDHRISRLQPLPEAKTLAERLVRRRTTLGMSQKEAAARIGVDPATSARWQRRERRADGRDGSAEWKDLSLITGRGGRTRAVLCTT